MHNPTKNLTKAQQDILVESHSNNGGKSFAQTIVFGFLPAKSPYASSSSEIARIAYSALSRPEDVLEHLNVHLNDCIDLPISIGLNRKSSQKGTYFALKDGVGSDVLKDSGIEYEEIQVASSPDLTEKNRNHFKKNIAPLSKKGLVVELTDCLNTEKAIALTEKGHQLAGELKDWRRNEPIRKLKEAHIPRKIHCPTCHEELMQTRFTYVPGELVQGSMLTTFGTAADGNWSLPFNGNDIGKYSIICPGCNGRLIGEDNLFLEGVLIEIKESSRRTT